MQSVIVHYQEIALKGRNRPWFVERLVGNIRAATTDLGVVKVRALMGRIELQHASNDDWPEVHNRLARLPGIANFSRAVRTRCDIDAIADTMLGELRDVQVESFRVTAQRADKRFPMTSPQIERELGGRIKSVRGWPVDLEHPELTVRVEILNDEAFCCLRKEPGAGGLPSGVSGRVLSDVGRHRFTGGRLPDDQAGLPGSTDPFPQLSDSFPHVAGQGGRARRAADPPPA